MRVLRSVPGRCLRNSLSQEPSSPQLVYITSYRRQCDTTQRNHRLLRVLHSEEDTHVRNRSWQGVRCSFSVQEVLIFLPCCYSSSFSLVFWRRSSQWARKVHSAHLYQLLIRTLWWTMKEENLTNAVNRKLVLSPGWCYGRHLSLTLQFQVLRCTLSLFLKLLPLCFQSFLWSPGSFLLTCAGIVCWAGVNLMHFSSIARDGGTDAFLDFLLESDRSSFKRSNEFLREHE